MVVLQVCQFLLSLIVALTLLSLLVERSLAHGTEQRNTLLTFFFHFLYRKKYIYSTLAVPTVPERIFSLFLAVLERDGVKNSLLSLAVPAVPVAPGITNL